MHLEVNELYIKYYNNKNILNYTLKNTLKIILEKIQ